MHGEQFAVMLVFLGFFFLVFGIWYMQKRENLALIEKGINPKESYRRPAPFKNLKWALLLIGAGSGLLLAFIIDEYTIPNKMGSYVDGGVVRYYHRDENPAIYFALIAIGGGLGLLVSYVMEKKWLDKTYENGNKS